jgi:hypothetical protein
MSQRLRKHDRLFVLPAALMLLFLVPCNIARAQGSGGLEGNITDPSGAVVPGATVRAESQTSRVSRSATADKTGHFEIAGLPAGRYSIAVTAPGFAPFAKRNVTVAAAREQRLDIRLTIESQAQKVQVNAEATQLQIAPESNASAVVISGRNLDALSNDPDELQSQLTALAGPSVGSGGGEIYINGFTGGDLPPKSDIREIRVNSDPFSVINDRLGYGRVDIFTKPGSSAYHGDFSTQYNNSAMNALSPFLAGVQPPSYHTWLWSGDFGGPLGKKASFYVNVQHRNINLANLVNTDILDSNANVEPYVATVANPRLLTNANGQVDFALTPQNTLTVRYDYFTMDERNNGVNTQTLPSQAYDYARYHDNLQIFDSQVISPEVLNTTQFQFLHFHNVETPQSVSPAINVLGAFLGGGSQYGSLDRHETHYEFQNYTTISLPHHLIQFGGFVRAIQRQEDDSQNFNGTFTFNSLSDYQQTEQALMNGLTMSQIQAAGYGPSQFNLTAGNLFASVNRIDGALFAGDDWKLSPHVTFSYGLRFESENVINDHVDWAPRLGIAWGLGHGPNTKTVLRAGWGIFYQRFDDDQMIIAARLNGINQLTYIVNQPDFFPTIPSISALSAASTSLPTIYRIAPNLHSPYDIDTAVSLEHQLLPNTTISLTYINSQGEDQFLTNDINAPLPGTFNPSDPSSGVRPLGNAAGNIYEYESAGIYRQNQVVANVHVNAQRVSVFGYYVFNNAYSDTAGVNSFATNPWNILADYGRAAFDVRHRFVIGSTFALPFAIRLSTVMMANSGLPFSVTLPQDLYGTGIYNARPAYATASTPPADIAVTPFGAFNIAPGSNAQLIPPNTENGPANFMLNLRLSRTFGFGGEGRKLHGGTGTAKVISSRRERRTQGLGGRGLSGGGGFGLGGATNHRYALTLSVSALNALNTVNLAPPIAVIGSPLFGQSLSLATGPYAAQVGNPVANRLINVGLTFSF